MPDYNLNSKYQKKSAYGSTFNMLHFGDNNQRIIGQTQKDNLASLYIKCMDYINPLVEMSFNKSFDMV